MPAGGSPPNLAFIIHWMDMEVTSLAVHLSEAVIKLKQHREKQLNEETMDGTSYPVYFPRQWRKEEPTTCNITDCTADQLIFTAIQVMHLACHSCQCKKYKLWIWTLNYVENKVSF